MADDNELLFQMRMQDQISGVMQGIEGSFKDVASVVQQQMAAMQQLTTALQAQAGGAKSATSAAQAHAAGMKVVSEAMRSAASDTNANATATKASAAAHGAHAEATKNSGEAAREAAEQNKSLARRLGEVTSTAKEAVEALVGLYATNEMAKASIEASVELEHTIRDIGAAAGASRAEVTELLEALNKKAGSGFAYAEQLEGLAKIGATLTTSTEQIETFATALGKISNGSNFQQLGNSVAQLLAQTNEGAEKVAPLADALGKLGLSARGGVESLTEISNMIARFTAGMDMSSTKIVGYAATFNKMFQPEQARMASAQFGMMLQTIEKQAREGGDGLKDLAGRLGETYDQMRKLGQEHPDEVFQKILQVTNAIKSSGGNPADFLKQFGLGDGRQLQQIEALSQHYRDLQKNIADAQNAGGGADAFNAEKLTPYDQAVRQLSNAWKELKEEFGQDFAGAAVQAFKALAAVIQEVTGVFHSMPEGAREAVAAFVILVPAIGGVTLGIGAFVRAFRELKDGLVSAGVALSEVGATMNGAATQAEMAAVKMEAAATGAASAEREVAIAAKETEEAVKLSWSNMALAVGTYMVAADAAHQVGLGIAGLINQQQQFGKQGITWGEEGLGLGAMLPDALGGGYFKGKLTDSMRSRRGAAGEHQEGEHHEGHGERKEGGGGERASGEHEAKPETANPTTPQSGTTPLMARNSLADFSPDIKAARDYEKAVEDLQTAIGKMDNATKAAMASEIQGAQQALELRRAELDPLNKMTDQWRQVMMSARAYTKAQQEAAAIEKQVFDARQEAYKRGEGDAGANRAEQFVRTTAPQTNRAQSDTAFAKEAEGMYRQLAAASAITQTEKDRLAVEQQIAKWQQDTTYTQAQIAQLTKILELTKEWSRELAQISQLNPQASSISKYNDDLAELNKRLKDGVVSQQEFNREKMALDQQSKAQRDPLGNIADQNNEELKEAQVVSKYHDADVKTLQQINQLKQQGITLDAQQSQALQGSNRALADVKEAQQQLDSLSSAFGSSLQQAVTGALNGQRGALREALASLGGQLFKMGTDQIFKQLTPSVASVLPGITSAAQNANNALAKAGASQMASTMANASQEIAQAQINIANATLAAGLTAQGAATNGAPGALPGPAGTNLPGSTGAAGVQNPSGLAQVISPGTAASGAAAAGGAGGNAPTVPAVTGTGITNLPTAVAGGAATVAGAAGAGAVASGLPSTVASGAFGSTGLTPQLPGNGIGSINPSQFSQAFPMPSFATSTIKSAGPPVSDADTSRWNEVFGRDPSPGEAVNIQKMGVEKALDVTNNPSMKAQDSQWALGNKDWKSVDPHMTNRDYLKSLEPKDQTTTTMTQPNPSFTQPNGMTIGNPSALMKLPEQLSGAMRDGVKQATQSGAFGDLSAAQKAFDPKWNGMPAPQQLGGSGGLGSALTDAKGGFYYQARMHETADQNIINPNGGAGGYYQFMPKTWQGLRSQNPGLGLPSSVTAATKDQQTAAYEAFTKGNVGALQSQGIPITDKNVFMSSFLGSGGASKFIKQMQADPNQTAAGLFPREAAQNHGDFYDKQGNALSLKGVYDKETKSFGTGNTTGYGPKSTDPSIVSTKLEQTSSLDQIKARGVDNMPTGAISSAQKQMQQATQQQMSQATEQFTKMQDQVQNQLKDSTQAFQTNFSGLGSSISKTSDTALGGVGDMGSFGQSISGMLSKLQSGGGGGGGGLGGLFGGGGGGGGFGDMGDFAAFHSGGKVGSNTGFLTRRVSSALFLGAPKFHDGLNSDEFPAVLQRGERVLTNAQEQKTTSIVDKLADAVQMSKGSPSAQHVSPAAQRAAGSRINMVVNVKDANSFRLSQSQIMAQAHSATMRSAAKHN